MKKIMSLVMCVFLIVGLMIGCASEQGVEDTENVSIEENDTQSSSIKDENANSVVSGRTATDEDMFSNRDYEGTYSENGSVTIQLNGDSAIASSNSVKISGGTITITEEATYVISGQLSDGMIIVDANDSAKIQIVFDNAAIHSETSAALYILEADKVFVTLAEGSENTLSNGGAFVAIDDNNIDATLFSKQDLTFNGSGSLTISSPAGHGIVCKDDLVYTDGTYVITAASHGLDVNDSTRITDEAYITVDAGKDGIHCENSDDTALGYVYISGGVVEVEAEGDGISAGSYMQIEGGVINVLAGGGSSNGSQTSSGFYGGFGGGKRQGQSSTVSTTTDDSTSMKGLKAVGNIEIAGGTIKINSADDAIHSDGSAIISGGMYEIESGDDAVHAEDTLTVTACDMTVTKCYEGLEAEKLYIQGGNIIITASDDGLNASGGTDASGTAGGRDGMFGGGRGKGGFSGGSGVIEISGGNLTVYSSGDGLDSNGTLTISGGYIYVANPSSGDTSVLDADSSPVITGGTFISTGASQMMAQSFASSSTQGVIACTVGNQKAGSMVTVTDSNGTVVIEYDVEYSCVLVIISSADIVKGETYTLNIGSASGDVIAN